MISPLPRPSAPSAGSVLASSPLVFRDGGHPGSRPGGHPGSRPGGRHVGRRPAGHPAVHPACRACMMEGLSYYSLPSSSYHAPDKAQSALQAHEPHFSSLDNLRRRLVPYRPTTPKLYTKEHTRGFPKIGDPNIVPEIVGSLLYIRTPK